MVEELRNLLTDKKSYMSTCSLASIRMLGMESLEWDPLVLRDSLQDVLKMDKIPQRLFDKVNCGYTLIGTSGYTASLDVFITCNMVMSNIPVEEGVIGMDDPESLSWGVYEYFKLTGDDETTSQFCIDTSIYAGEILYANGITVAPKWLDWVTFDPDKIARLDSVLDDPTFYMQRQTGMVIGLENICKAKEAELMTQLASLDKILPVNQ